MRFTFLGTGSAFCLENYQSNILISQDKDNLLIDAGGDIRWALKEKGLSFKDINGLYITHGHADHIGGVEYLAFSSYFTRKVDQSLKKMNLYCHKGLVNELWSNALSLGLGSIQGKVVDLHDYFNIIPLEDNTYFTWGGSRFKIVQAVHIMNGYSIVKTFGLMINNGKKIYITGDTQFNPNQIRDFYDQADFIIQDCETTPFCSGVHANFEELKTLNKETKKKIFLTHYQDNVVEDFENWQSKAKKEGFKKFLKKGESLIF